MAWSQQANKQQCLPNGFVDPHSIIKMAFHWTLWGAILLGEFNFLVEFALVRILMSSLNNIILVCSGRKSRFSCNEMGSPIMRMGSAMIRMSSPAIRMCYPAMRWVLLSTVSALTHIISLPEAGWRIMALRRTLCIQLYSPRSTRLCEVYKLAGITFFFKRYQKAFGTDSRAGLSASMSYSETSYCRGIIAITVQAAPRTELLRINHSQCSYLHKVMHRKTVYTASKEENGNVHNNKVVIINRWVDESKNNLRYWLYN